MADSAEDISEKLAVKADTSNGEMLVREKRFLNDVVGSAFQSFQSGNWRECGRTRWGTTIYTNGIGMACFGSCPQHIRCGYGDNSGFGPTSYGYQGRINFGQINLG